MTEEQLLKSNIGNFRMYLEPILNKDILEEITAEDSKNRLYKLENWPNTSNYLTFVVEYSDASAINRKIRIRYEDDFIIIWYHNSVSLVDSKNTPIDVARNAVNNVLGKEFVIGQDNTLAVAGTGFITTETELVMSTWPNEISEVNAVTCDYYASRDKRDWGHLFCCASVLIKDKDAIVVMEKAKVRRLAGKQVFIPPYIYEGLLAAKVRLSEKNAEAVKNKPVLARNVIFEEDVDTSGISDRLLNGCMWPIDDKIAVGMKDVGSASQLRPEPKYGKEKGEEA